MRRFLKISAVLALLFFILLITATIVVKIYFPPERIKAIVVAKITEAIGRKVSVGDVNVGIFRGVDIHDIYVGEDPEYGDLPFIKVKRVTVGYNFRELLHKRVVFDRITIDAPEAFIRSRKGKLALLGLVKKPPVEEKPKPKAPLPVTVTIKKCEVRDIHLSYDADDVKAELKGIDIALDGELLPFKGANVVASSRAGENISASAKGMTLASGLQTGINVKMKGADIFSVQGDVLFKGLRVGVKGKSLRPLDAGVKLDIKGDLKGGAEIRSVSLSLGKGSRFALSGRVGELKKVRGVEIKASGETELGEISGIVSEFVKVPATGSVKIEGTEVKGDLPGLMNVKTRVVLNRVKVSHKGMTVPLDGYLKAEADNKGSVTLTELKVNSADAVRVEASAAASKFGKGKVSAKARVAVDNAKAFKLLPKDIAQKVGKIEISGDTKVDLAVGRDSEKGPVRVKVSGSSAMSRIEAGPVSVESPSATFSVNSDDVLKGKSFVKADLKTKSVRVNRDGIKIDVGALDTEIISSADSLFKKDGMADAKIALRDVMLHKEDVDLNSGDIFLSASVSSHDGFKETASMRIWGRAKSISINKADIELKDEILDFFISAVTDDLPGRKASIKLGVMGSGINAKKGNTSIKEEAVEIALETFGDFKAGDVSIGKLEVAVPRFIKASAEGRLKGWGKELALNAGVDEIDHKKALDRIPSSIRQKMPKISLEGRSSVAATINGGMAGDGLTVRGLFKTRGAGVALPEKGVVVRRADGDVEFALSKAARSLSGVLTVGGVEKQGVFEKPLGVLTGFDLSAEGSNVSIKKLSVSVPEKAVSVSLSGRIVDYSSAPRPELDMILAFNPSQRTIDIIKGLAASGTASVTASVRSEREKEVAVTGGLKMSRLDLSFKDRAKVRDLNGDIRFAQRIRYAKGVEVVTEKEGKSGLALSSSVYDLLRPYIKKDYDLTMASASFDEYEIGPLSMDVSWNNGNISVDRYNLALFEGGTTGRIKAVYHKDAPEFSVSSNIAGIRLDKLFKDKRGGEETEINADLNLRGKGTDVEGEVNVTRIGKDLLDRGLLRLDPNESNPQLVDVRRKVNSLGWVPKEVSIWIRHGELNMDITLQRKKFTLLNIVSLEKIPVRRVPVGYLIKKGLKKGEVSGAK